MYTGWPGQFMKTAMINTLKKINRTVLEMDLGILFLGVSAQIIGAFIAKDEAMYAKSLWFGVLLALVSTYHMYRSLDRALDQPEKTATKMIIRAYVLRYVMLIFFLLVMMKTGVMNPLIFFFTYVICSFQNYILQCKYYCTKKEKSIVIQIFGRKVSIRIGRKSVDQQPFIINQ